MLQGNVSTILSSQFIQIFLLQYREQNLTLFLIGTSAHEKSQNLQVKHINDLFFALLVKRVVQAWISLIMNKRFVVVKQSQKIQVAVFHIITPWLNRTKITAEVIKRYTVILLFAHHEFIEISHEIFYLNKAQGLHCLSYKLFVKLQIYLRILDYKIRILELLSHLQRFKSKDVLSFRIY